MAALMLSFWSTNFMEIELYQDRHLPLMQVRALLTDNPIPVPGYSSWLWSRWKT